MNDAEMKSLSISGHNASMASQRTIPRINGRMLKSGQFRGDQVAIVGKLLAANNPDGKISFESSDGQKFFVTRDNQMQCNEYSTAFVEICGTVQNDGTVAQQSHQDWGNEFIMSTWDKYVSLARQFPAIF